MINFRGTFSFENNFFPTSNETSLPNPFSDFGISNGHQESTTGLKGVGGWWRGGRVVERWEGGGKVGRWWRSGRVVEKWEGGGERGGRVERCGRVGERSRSKN